MSKARIKSQREIASDYKGKASSLSLKGILNTEKSDKELLDEYYKEKYQI